MMSATPTELPQTAAAPQLTPVDLAAFRAGIAGRRYAELIQHHIRRSTERQIVAGIVGTEDLLPPEVQALDEAFVGRWNERIHDADFWRTDCAVVLDAIVADAHATLAVAGVTPDDETLFNL